MINLTFEVELDLYPFEAGLRIDVITLVNMLNAKEKKFIK